MNQDQSPESVAFLRQLRIANQIVESASENEILDILLRERYAKHTAVRTSEESNFGDGMRGVALLTSAIAILMPTVVDRWMFVGFAIVLLFIGIQWSAGWPWMDCKQIFRSIVLRLRTALLTD